MPVHDWSKVKAGLFHHFRHSWVEAIKRTLNDKILSADHYAMAEQLTAGFDPSPNGNVALAVPKLAADGETEMEFYRRRQTGVAVRHVSGDRVVAMVEIVSPGNKNHRTGIEQFVRKAAELLDQRIHLLILDLLPPGPPDPFGIHPLIWEFIEGVELPRPARPLTLVAYETDLTVRSYVVPLAAGDALPDMPLFLAPRACVEVPLEPIYQAAFAAFPRRWRHLLE